MCEHNASNNGHWQSPSSINDDGDAASIHDARPMCTNAFRIILCAHTFIFLFINNNKRKWIGRRNKALDNRAHCTGQFLHCMTVARCQLEQNNEFQRILFHFIGGAQDEQDALQPAVATIDDRKIWQTLFFFFSSYLLLTWLYCVAVYSISCRTIAMAYEMENSW